MTSLQLYAQFFELSLSSYRKVVAEKIAKHEEEMLMMKALLLLVVIGATAGETAALAAATEAGISPASWIWIQMACAWGGVIGCVVSLGMAKPKDVSFMAWDLLGNFGTALGLCPFAIPIVCARFGLEPSLPAFTAGSVVMGIFGIAIVKLAQGDFLNWVQTMISTMTRIPQKPVDPNQTDGKQ